MRHDGPMPDYPRLAKAIQARATALGWKQRDLIQRTHISRGTLQTLWKGVDVPPPSPATKIGVEDLLGWERGSVDAILAGGEPTTRPQAPEGAEGDANAASAAAPRASTLTDMPLRVQLALGEGRPLDYDVLEFEVGGRTMSIVAWAQSGVFDTEEDRAVALEQLKMFHKLMGTLRREGEVETDDMSANGDG